MDGFNHCDSNSDFDSFLNHEFLCGNDKGDDDVLRDANSADSPLPNFHSPRSIVSESTEVMGSGSACYAVAAGASDKLHAFDAPSSLQQQQQQQQPCGSSASMAPDASFEPDPFRKRFDAAAATGVLFQQPFVQQHGAEMWCSVSDGAGLTRSISSLALDNVPSLHQATPFNFPQDVQIKTEDDCNALSTSFAYLGQPFRTPTQPSINLYSDTLTGTPLEKKRKLSLIDSDSQPASVSSDLAAAGGMGDGFESKDAVSLKKAGKRKPKGGADAASGFSPRAARKDSVAADGEAGSANEKDSRKAGPRRPPPSASQVTEAGYPFPVIDTTAKHSSLFVHPDTTGLTKREARLVKNRAAAFLSRQRKREQFEELEVKCKAMSIMAWRMWEVIAGPNAPSEMLGQTVLPTLLSGEDPMAIICLEQVIAKQGASIAPTADDTMMAPSRDSAEPDNGSGDAQDGTNGARPWQADAIDKLKADLAASRKREQDLIAELEALRQARLVPLATAASLAVQPAIVADQPSFWQQTSSATVAAPPFRGVQPHAPSLTIAPGLAPSSSTSGDTIAEFSQSSDGDPSAELDKIKVEDMDTSFSFAATPTIESFSAAARKSKKLQLANIATPKYGVGLLYRGSRFGSGFSSSTADRSPSIPSSPSSLSSSSDATQRGAGSGEHPPHSPYGQLGHPRRTASSMALMVILFSIALLGMPAGDLAKLGISRSSGELNSGFSLGQVLGPVEPTSRYSLIRPSGEEEEEETEDELVSTSTQPSSHLSDTDLSLGFDVDSHMTPAATAADTKQQPQQQQQTSAPPLIVVDSEMPDESSSTSGEQQQKATTDFMGSSSTVAAVAAMAALAQIKRKGDSIQSSSL